MFVIKLSGKAHEQFHSKSQDAKLILTEFKEKLLDMVEDPTSMMREFEGRKWKKSESS